MPLQKLSVLFFCFIALTNCAQENEQQPTPAKPSFDAEKKHSENQNNDTLKTPYTLSDYLSNNKRLNTYVDSVMGTLDEKSIIAQLIMPAAGKYGKPKITIDGLIKDQLIGGILMLNGTKQEFTSLIAEFNQDNIDYDNLPFLYSADAEPSLVNRKIIGSTPVKKANEIDSIQGVTSVAKTISKDLNDIGINYNFAPVVDMSKNSTVGYRGFGKKPENKEMVQKRTSFNHSPSNAQRLVTGTPKSRITRAPPSSGRSMIKPAWTTSPPRRSISLIPAAAVPPVAMRSSISKIFAPALIASSCISIVAVPYSRA